MNRAKLGFEDSSGSESEEDFQPSIKQANKRSNQNKDLIAQSLKYQKLSKQLEDKAHEAQDEIYEYDELYDDILNKKQQKAMALQNKNKGETGSKYISGLLKAKNKREQDRLRVEETKIQKERELEGDEFKDKEVFVTSAYKEHRANISKIELDEDTQEPLKDMTSFHRAVLNDDIKGESEPGNIQVIIPSDNKSAVNIKNNYTDIKKRQNIQLSKQFEELDKLNNVQKQKILPKSKLLPKLSNEEIEAAGTRYFARKQGQN